MTNSDNIFENDTYVVVLSDLNEGSQYQGMRYTQGYAAVNKETGVKEILSPCLPDIISAAEQLDIAMEQEVWKWARINAEAESLMEDNNPGEEIH